MLTKEEMWNILKVLIQNFWPQSWDQKLLSASYSDCIKPRIVYLSQWVNILLSSDAETDEYLTCYQLSHQLLHYLSLWWVWNKEKVTFLEEWLATQASLIGCRTIYWDNDSEVEKMLRYTYLKNDNYWTAYRAIDPILKKYPLCIRNISERKLCNGQSILFSDITMNELLEEINWDYRDEVRILMNWFYE